MICIENANVVLENGILWDGVVLVEKDRIVAVGPKAEVEIPEHAERVDAKGAYVGPGFVDIHNHGGDNVLFADDPEKAAAHFLAHGETTVLATLYTNFTAEGYIDAMDRIEDAMKNGKAGKAIGGIYMEGPYMNAYYGSMGGRNQWRSLIDENAYIPVVDRGRDLVKVWAIAPEREGIEPFMAYAKQANHDVVFSVGHSEASPQQIRKLKKYGIKLQTHCMNATGRRDQSFGFHGTGPDEYCLANPDMYAELICDSLAIHVNADLQRLILQAKGMDKIVLISDSNVGDGSVSTTVTQAPDLSFDAEGLLSGSLLTMDAVCKNIMTHTNCGIAQAFLMASRNPARAIGMDDEIGTIEAGKKANLVFVDHMFHVEKVMLNGAMVK